MGYAVHIILSKMSNYEYDIFIVEKLKHVAIRKKIKSKCIHTFQRLLLMYGICLPRFFLF